MIRISAFDSVPGSLRGVFVECGLLCLHARLCIEFAGRDRDLGFRLCSFGSLLFLFLNLVEENESLQRD